MFPSDLSMRYDHSLCVYISAAELYRFHLVGECACNRECCSRIRESIVYEVCGPAHCIDTMNSLMLTFAQFADSIQFFIRRMEMEIEN